MTNVEKLGRFVLLRHEPAGEQSGARTRDLHWDLMLEWGGALKTWALAERPASVGSTSPWPAESTGPIEAEALADHRLHYLEYEGPISGDRGFVSREDQGTWLPACCDPHDWEFELEGSWLRGRFGLSHLGGDRWQFRCLGPRR